MATATWHAPSSTSANGHGTKRRATDELDNAQRLTKRFHLMNIGSSSNTASHDVKLTNNKDNPGMRWPKPHQQQYEVAHTPHPASMPNNSEHMQVEDTKNRVYIDNLEEELAGLSDSEDEQRITFLPDVEKRLSKLPTHLLAGDRPKGMGNSALVLYSIPRALSVPEDKDSVRKAIIETRARAREQQPTQLSQDAMLHDNAGLEYHDTTSYDESAGHSHDEDAMDLG